VRYELLIQSKEPGQPWDPATLDRLLHERGAFANPDGSRTWRLKPGDVQVRALVEGGKVIATELRLDLSDKLELIRAVVLEGVPLAEECGGRLVDPQLAKTLTISDEGLVADQYLRTAQYAGQYAGVSTAVLASFGQVDSDEGIKPGTKVLFAIIAFLAAIYFISQRILVSDPPAPEPKQERLHGPARDKGN
jgi:hypothetical protein